MKIVLDERLKHRLIGLAVIISLAAIFAPAIMKKSAQHMDRDVGLRMQLPAKPLVPDVAVTEQKEVFKSVKVAYVKLPELKVPKQIEQVETRLAKIEMPAQALNTELVNIEAPVVKAPLAVIPKALVPEKKLIRPALKVAKSPEKRLPPKPVPVSLVLANNESIYSVQLASFTRRENAMVLVNRLKSKGYVARVDKITGKQGDQYKVYVGKSKEREQALKLKNQLAAGMQLYGFIVTGAG